MINTPATPNSELFGVNVYGMIAGFGLLALYTQFAMIVLGKVQEKTRNLSQTIMFSELPDPSRLFRLCKDIILARSDGDLLLEEELTKELLQIYRSPESIMEHTRLIAPAVNNDDDDDDDEDNDDDEKI